MPRTPDPSYWGNPPKTPVSKYAQQAENPQTSGNQAPIPPTPAQQPGYASTQPAQQQGAAQSQGTYQQGNAGSTTAQQQEQTTPQLGTAANQPTPSVQAAPSTQGTSAQGQEAYQQGSVGDATAQQQQNPSATSPGYAQPSAPTAPPAPQPAQKKGNKGVVIAIVAAIVVLLLGMAGCSACTVALSSGANSYLGSTYGNPQNIPSFDNDQRGNSSSTDSDQAYLNAQTRSAFDLQGSSALTEEELSQVQAGFFEGSSIAPNSEGIYPQGVFHVGTDLPAGTYWFSGSNSALSYFFILQPTSDGASTYNTVHVNSYYGHNLMDLKDGEVLILVNNGTMTPIAKMTQQFTSPYGSGVYRVGTDIPAGSYRVIVGDGADDYSAYYVMSDLNYSDDSYLESDYFVSGDTGTEITLEEGTYVELYNMCLIAIRS